MTPTWIFKLPSDALPQAGQRGGGQAAAGGACSDLNIMLDPPPEWQLLPLSWLDQHRAAEARALGVGSVRAPLRYCHHRRRRPSQRHRRQPLQFDCECVEPQFWSYRKAEMHVCGREDRPRTRSSWPRARAGRAGRDTSLFLGDHSSATRWWLLA
jgi:hypothetical protein